MKKYSRSAMSVYRLFSPNKGDFLISFLGVGASLLAQFIVPQIGYPNLVQPILWFIFTITFALILKPAITVFWKKSHSYDDALIDQFAQLAGNLLSLAELLKARVIHIDYNLQAINILENILVMKDKFEISYEEIAERLKSHNYDSDLLRSIYDSLKSNHHLFLVQSPLTIASLRKSNEETVEEIELIKEGKKTIEKEIALVKDVFNSLGYITSIEFQEIK